MPFSEISIPVTLESEQKALKLARFRPNAGHVVLGDNGL